MKLKILPDAFTVCKLPVETDFDANMPFCFLARTDEECSLVCPTALTPSCTIAREDGWKAFRIKGVLDFGLVGILARIASVLAENGIPIFAVSTYNTDYLLIKEPCFDKAAELLRENGYEFS